MTQQQAAQRPPSTVPDWDRKAVARPYLRQLRQQAVFGSFDRQWVDATLTDLAAELRAVYNEQDADLALDGLERVFDNIDQVALAARAAAQLSDDDLARGQTAEIGGRWKAVTRPGFLAHLNGRVHAEHVKRAIHRLLTQAGATAMSGVAKVQQRRQVSVQREIGRAHV